MYGSGGPFSIFRPFALSLLGIPTQCSGVDIKFHHLAEDLRILSKSTDQHRYMVNESRTTFVGISISLLLYTG